ncbi:MAG: SH3 domain-containing protein [Trichodesmium sp. MAG_R03]|nr:SH3 domain-containing protein [Trichodesmium sp. MAG_R03]
MKQMMTWTKYVAMTTLLSLAAVSGMSLTSIAAVSSQKTLILDESETTVTAETQSEDKFAHRSHGKSYGEYYGRCRQVATHYKNLRVRTYPWGRIIGVLRRGTRVRVIGYYDGWAKISYPCYGYVYARYLRDC